jgi:hypothetical protein
MVEREQLLPEHCQLHREAFCRSTSDLVVQHIQVVQLLITPLLHLAVADVEIIMAPVAVAHLTLELVHMHLQIV